LVVYGAQRNPPSGIPKLSSKAFGAMQGDSSLDPSRCETAVQQYRHLVREIDVRELRCSVMNLKGTSSMRAHREVMCCARIVYQHESHPSLVSSIHYAAPLLLASISSYRYVPQKTKPRKNQCDIPHQATTSWPVSRITILSSGSCNTLQSQSRVWLTILTDEDVYELMLEEDAAVVAREGER
jgi:hypothetical protein